MATRVYEYLVPRQRSFFWYPVDVENSVRVRDSRLKNCDKKRTGIQKLHPGTSTLPVYLYSNLCGPLSDHTVHSLPTHPRIMASAMRSVFRIQRSLPQSFGSAPCCFSSDSRPAHATAHVQQFLANAEAKSIDHRILVQQVPALMLMLIDDSSNESGPMTNELLKKIREHELTLSPRISSLVSYIVELS